MLTDLNAAVDRIIELRDQAAGGAAIVPEDAAAALALLQVMLEDDGQSTAEEILAAGAVLCSVQSSLFFPLSRQMLAPLVRNGIRHSHETAILAQRLLRTGRPRVALDERARNWLARDFILMAVQVQYAIDELLAAR